MDSIASAVVLPDQDPSPLPSTSSPTGTKRRQSSVSEQDAKRPRLSDGSNTIQRRDSNSEAVPPAPTPLPKERGRERRLFGNVLGALAHNPVPAGQRRRAEIERRQQAQRRLEDEESEQRRAERVAMRTAQRWKGQKHFDKSSMRLRHDNLLAMAHFLKTKSEPQLFYKPWEVTADEKKIIHNQIAEARETIRQENEQYKRDRDAERSKTGFREGAADPSDDTKQIPHPGKEMAMDVEARPVTINGSPTDGRVPSPTHSDHQNGFPDGHSDKMVSEKPADAGNRQSEITSHQSPAEANNSEAVDETGEEVVEAAEDTVIY